MYKNVIWATDGFEGADRALVAALELAVTTHGRIVAVHVNQRLTGRAGGWPALPDESDRLVKIRDQVRSLEEHGIPTELVVRRTHAAPAPTIAAIAEELDADVIVCGTQGRSSLGGAVLGSVAHALLHVAPCPVLVVSEHAKSVKAPAELPAEAVLA